MSSHQLTTPLAYKAQDKPSCLPRLDTGTTADLPHTPKFNMKPSHSILLHLVCLPSALAWGSLGHNTTGYLASHFVSAQTEAYLKHLLRNQNDNYLADIASWADVFKKQPAGEFSQNLHFIDAHDDPASESCQVDYARDCKQGGCIISALANYTHRARDTRLPASERQMAFKFLVHFIADLHQPLHNEDVARGGTQIPVGWERGQDDLHAVWDTLIAEKMTESLASASEPTEPTEPTARLWADGLAYEITSGRFAAKRQTWLDKFDAADAHATAMAWSDEANAYVCTHVFPPGLGPRKIKHRNLYRNGYYHQAAPVVEEQIARAGFRMAVWLDSVVDSLAAEGGGDEL